MKKYQQLAQRQEQIALGMRRNPATGCLLYASR
jgi:hypothetical protein